MSKLSEFKDIKGYEGRYQINKEGEVKSLKRDVITSQNIIHVKECIRKHHYNTRGIRIIQLCAHGDRTTHIISDLVKEAFPDESHQL